MGVHTSAGEGSGDAWGVEGEPDGNEQPSMTTPPINRSGWSDRRNVLLPMQTDPYSIGVSYSVFKNTPIKNTPGGT